MSHNGTPTRVLAALAVACILLGASAPTAGAIARDEVISRAEVWVDARVPYSQSRWARTSGSLVATSVVSPTRFGYRTDCSGFVSMCLGFKSRKGYPLSLSTATLDDVMVRIKKADLRPGDVILRPNDLIVAGKRVPYGHAVIFARWLDAAHTRYLAYHESSSARGTVRAEISWGRSGFWDAAGFAPYRYGGVEDAARPPVIVGP